MKQQRKIKPLTPEKLSELAIFYVGRFATSRGNLARYLNRKIGERGWEGDEAPDVAALIEKLVGYGYVDDAAYAEAKAQSLTRRGYGARRVDAAVRAAGIGDADRERADDVVENTRISAALKLAQRRRWGPFADEREDDPAKREKQFSAFIRAGHDMALSRRILRMEPGADVSVLED